MLTAAERLAHERALPRRRVNTAQEIGFAAEYFGETIGPISVIAGEGAPTITGGWLKVAQVQRFQRTSITVPEGYAPRVLTVPILFDAVIETKERPRVEQDIATLERMAGRPKGDSLPGEAPRVEVFSTDSSDNRTNLIPRKLQEDGELLWWDHEYRLGPESDQRCRRGTDQAGRCRRTARDLPRPARTGAGPQGTEGSCGKTAEDVPHD